MCAGGSEESESDSDDDGPPDLEDSEQPQELTQEQKDVSHDDVFSINHPDILFIPIYVYYNLKLLYNVP